MAVLTFIRFPTNAIITKEQLEGIVDINENRLTEIFKRTFLSGVMADNITSDFLKPVKTGSAGSVVEFDISPGAAIIGSGFMVILEETLSASADFSIYGDLTLFLKFDQDWSDDITTIQKPTGNIIEVSKIQLQTDDILEWLNFDPTSFVAGETSNNFPIGKLIETGGVYSFKLDEGYRRLYAPNIRYFGTNFNIIPSITDFCSLFEFLSCRGGESRGTSNPFGMTSNDLGNLLEIIKAFITIAGVVDKAGGDFVVSGAGTTTLVVAAGEAIVSSGKYVSNNSAWSTTALGAVEGTFHVYIHAYRDSDGDDTHEIVMTQTDYSANEDYLILADIVLFYDVDHMEISSITDLREQLQLKTTTTSESFKAPASIPELYITEETSTRYIGGENRYNVNVMWGDQFDGEWVSSTIFKIVNTNSYITGQWDPPTTGTNKEKWYIYDPDKNLYHPITVGVVDGGDYRFTISGDAGYPGYPQSVSDAKVVSKLDWAFVQYKKHADEDWEGVLQFFPTGYSELEIICPSVVSNVNYDYRIEGWLNGQFVYSDIKQNTSTPALSPYESAGCRVTLTSDQTVGAGAMVKIDFDDVLEEAIAGDWDTTDKQFEASEAGTYIITVKIEYDASVGALGYLAIKKNGNIVLKGIVGFGVTNLVTRLVLAVNDQISFWIKNAHIAATDIVRGVGNEIHSEATLSRVGY